MVYLDTNTLIRYFTNDDKEKAQLVTKLLDSEKVIGIVDVVFPEIEYVLSGVYAASREKIINAFKFIVALPNVKLSKIIRQAVSLYENTTLDMADCIIVVYSFGESLASFDENLLKITEVKKFW